VKLKQAIILSISLITILVAERILLRMRRRQRQIGICRHAADSDSGRCLRNRKRSAPTEVLPRERRRRPRPLQHQPSAPPTPPPAAPAPPPPPPPPPQVDSSATVFDNIQAMDSWQSCSFCAGAGGNGPTAGHGLNQHVELALAAGQRPPPRERQSMGCCRPSQNSGLRWPFSEGELTCLIQSVTGGGAVAAAPARRSMTASCPSLECCRRPSPRNPLAAVAAVVAVALEPLAEESVGLTVVLEGSGAASPFPWKDFPRWALRFRFRRHDRSRYLRRGRQMPIWRCLRRILRRIRSATIW